MNHLDAYFQAQAPTVMVPKHEPLPPLEGCGHRLLMSATGVYYEAVRPWFHLVHKVADLHPVVMPYGEVEEKMDLRIEFPLHLVQRFRREAGEKLPNECSAWITMDTESGEFRYMMLEEIEAKPDFLRVHRPELGVNEVLVLDLHSHGMIPAFFSRRDNRDDRGEFKIAGVIGNLDKDTPTAEFRLCAGGLFMPLKVNAERI